MTSAVFLDAQTMGSDISLSPISRLFNAWQSFEHTSPEQINERCINAEVVIVNKVILDAQTLSSLPQLKIVAVTATGTNNIDHDCAATLGIKIVNVQGYAAPAVAQHCFSYCFNWPVKYNSIVNL